MFESEPQRDQFEKVRLLGPTPGGGYSFETQRGDIYHGKPSLAGGHSPGDRLTVGYLSPGGMREPVIVDGWASTIVRYPKLASLPFTSIPGLIGVWSQGQGCPALSGLSSRENAPWVIDSELPSSYVDLGPSHNSLPILGHVVFEAEDGKSVLAILWQKQRLIGSYGLELTAVEHSVISPMPHLWTLALGPSYSLPTGIELALDYRDGYLIHDRSTRQLGVFGSGTSELRNTAFVVSEAGSLAYSGSLGHRTHQSTLFAGRLIKCWHSFLRPGQSTDDLRETQDGLIRAFRQSRTGITSAWTLDPQTLLPTCQISTSEAHYATIDDKGQGRWPISVDAKTMVVWVSGSEQLAANGDNTLLQLLPNKFATPAPESATTYNWGRTKIQRAAIAGISTDTGQVRWKREIVNAADYILDADSVDYTETNESNPAGPRHGIEVLDQPSFYTNEFTYRGFATPMVASMGQVNYSLSPANSTKIDPDEGVNEDEYCSYTGSLEGSWRSYPGLGYSALAPDYDFFEPGGLRLFPLPISQGLDARFELNSENPAIVGKNPVGGCLALDSQNYTFAVYARQRPVVSGRNGKTDSIACLTEMDWREVSPEQWVDLPPEAQVPGGPTRVLSCAQYGAFAKQDLYWLGKVEQMVIHIVALTLPDGSDGGSTDVSQYVSRSNSSLSWAVITQIYQIIPIYEATVFLLLRDRYVDYPADDLPSVVVDVWTWGSGSSLIQTIELWTDRSTYYDSELEVTRRRYDQYAEVIGPGKGAPSSDGSYWVTFRLRVHDRQMNTYSNEWVRLRIDPIGSVTVTATRYSTTDGNTWPGSIGQHSSMAIAGDRSINSTDGFSETDSSWRVVSKSFV